MKCRLNLKPFFTFIMIFAIIASLISSSSNVAFVSAQANYVDVNVNALPVAENDRYIVFMTEASRGSVRLTVFDKQSKSVVRSTTYGVRDNWGGAYSMGHYFAFAAKFIDLNRILLVTVKAQYESSPYNGNAYLYSHVVVYNVLTGTFSAARETTLNRYDGSNPVYVSNAFVSRIERASQTEYWFYASTAGTRCQLAYYVKVVLSSDLNSVSSVNRYDVVVTDVNRLKRGEIRTLNDLYMLLVMHRPGDSTLNIQYYVVNRNTGSRTLVFEHFYENDFQFEVGERHQSLLFVETRGSFLVLNYYVANTIAGGNIKVVFTKLVFNNTFTNLIAAYRTAVAVSSGLNDQTWFFTFMAPKLVKIYQPAVIGGQNKLAEIKLSVSNTDSVDDSVSVAVLGLTHPEAWSSFTFRSPYLSSCNVAKLYWLDGWVAELYNARCRLYYGLPIQYPSLEAEMLQETQSWWDSDTIARDVAYPIMIRVYDKESGLKVRDAEVKVYLDGEDVCTLRTGANGVAVAYVYFLTKKITAEISITVSYAGDLIATWSKTFNVRDPTYKLLLMVLHLKDYKSSEYYFFNESQYNETLMRSTNYAFILRLLKEGVEPIPNALIRVQIYEDGKLTAVKDMTTWFDGTARFWTVFGAASTVVINASAYVSNVKVAEEAFSFAIVEVPRGEQEAPSMNPTIIPMPWGGAFDLIAIIPLLAIIFVPTFAFYSVMPDYRGLLIGLNAGLVIAVITNMIPIYALLLLAIVDALAFMKAVRE
ncbi:MAG: hypothetical protein QXE92_03695 [Thermofilaceae archaeon]